MHGWTANYLGDPTAKDAGRLTFNPLVHLDLWGSVLMPLVFYIGSAGQMIFGYAKPVPFNPYNLRDQKYGSAKVAIAGPLANLVMALLFGLLIRFMPLSLNFSLILSKIVLINILLMVINLVPIPPLDGSKVLAAFLPYKWQDKFYELEKYGFILVIIFLWFGFGLILPVIDYLFRLIIG